MTPPLKEKSKKFMIQPFGTSVEVIVSDDVRRSAEKHKNLLYELKLPPVLEAFTVLTQGSRELSMFLPMDASFGLVAHESFHIVHFVLSDCGVKFDDELYAYHLGELSERVVEFVSQAKTEKGYKS